MSSGAAQHRDLISLRFPYVHSSTLQGTNGPSETRQFQSLNHPFSRMPVSRSVRETDDRYHARDGVINTQCRRGRLSQIHHCYHVLVCKALPHTFTICEGYSGSHRGSGGGKRRLGSVETLRGSVAKTKFARMSYIVSFSMTIGNKAQGRVWRYFWATARTVDHNALWIRSQVEVEVEVEPILYLKTCIQYM